MQFRNWRRCVQLVKLTLPIIAFVVSTSVSARPSASVKNATIESGAKDVTPVTLVLPYAFTTDTMGLNLGLGAMVSGYHQPQMTAGITVFGGEVSEAIGGGVWNYKLPFTDRWFFSIYGMQGYYPDQRAYSATRQPFFPSDRPFPGSNDSSNDQFIQADGSSNFWDMKLEYTLPIGDAKSQGSVEYLLSDGLLSSQQNRVKSWNPLKTGVSTFVIRQFNRYQSYVTENRVLDGAIHALELGRVRPCLSTH